MNRTRALLVVAMTLAVGLTVYASNIYVTGDSPVAIPDNSGGVITACQTINVPDSIVITDAEVEMTGAHTWVGDLTVEVTSPASTTLTILNRPGRTGSGAGNSDDLQDATPIRYSDVAPSGASAETMGDAPCGGLIDGSPDCPDNYIPAPDTTDTPNAGNGTDFGDFAGENAQGVWTLCAADSAGGDTGTLTSWRLAINKPIPVELISFSIE